MSNKLTGYDAMDWAETYGSQLHKYADLTDGARKITLDEAFDIANEDPELIWTTASDLPNKQRAAI